MSKKAFTGSLALKQVINQYGWSLHSNIQSSSRMEPLIWDEIGASEPDFFFAWESYLFLPEPKAYQTYAGAFAETRYNGAYPVLKFRKNEYSNINSFSGAYNDAGFDLYFLTHLIFKEKEAVALSHPLVYPPYSSRLSIPIHYLVDMFSRHFTITTFDEEGKPHFKSAKNLN